MPSGSKKKKKNARKKKRARNLNRIYSHERNVAKDGDDLISQSTDKEGETSGGERSGSVEEPMEEESENGHAQNKQFVVEESIPTSNNPDSENKKGSVEDDLHVKGSNGADLSGSSSSSSDGESQPVEKPSDVSVTALEADPNEMATSASEVAVQSVEVLPVEYLVVTDVKEDELVKNLVASEALEAVSVEKSEAIQVTESTPTENYVVTQVIESTPAENSEVTNVVESTLVETSVVRVIESTTVVNTTVTRVIEALPDSSSTENNDSLPPSSLEPTPTEKPRDDSEFHQETESKGQKIISAVPPVRATSWTNCCGLFELFRGSNQ